MLKVFTIRDGACEAFMRPFFAQAAGAAIREFADLANNPEHPVGQHPEDYTLFEIGWFDEATGEICGLELGPRSLGNGSTFQVVPEHLQRWKPEVTDASA